MGAISQTTFLDAFSWKKKFCILISLKGPISNIPVLVQCWRIYAALGGDQLKAKFSMSISMGSI